MTETVTAETAGFCFGVRRAVQLCEKAAEEYGQAYTMGPIIHNGSVIRMLEARGVRELSDIDELKPGDTVIIRSHGIGREETEALERSGAKVIDATCPFVSKIHNIVRKARSDGSFVIIIGERDHPEVRAISGWCGEHAVFGNVAELEVWMYENRAVCEKHICVVSQTTAIRSDFEKCVELLKKLCTNVNIFDTICDTTFLRQQEARALSKRADAMLVIGSKNSANTMRLVEVCRSECEHVFMIETAEELDTGALKEFSFIGVTAGASTPAWIIKEVNQKMIEEIKNDAIVEETVSAPEKVEEVTEAVETAVETAAEAVEETVPAAEPEQEAAAEPETFEEMLEKSIKTLYTGERVSGIVAAITPTEISVDLGTKHAGYIPIAEFTDDPAVKPEEAVKVGDEIEAFVMRVNDVEGTVMLSKKRLDSVKSWDAIEDIRAEKAVVEGVVTEENKGGVVVSMKGIRVFVPASQTGLGRDEPMSTLLKQKVKLRITEVNQSRRRVVGSIRAVQVEERRAKADAIWNEIEVGKTYTGVVKSMTSYGAFVDIGGIDGMVHVSEVSWTRIKQPSDVLSVGQEIEVYVISFDKEKKKISLGYRKEADNPWVKFTGAYKVGDVTNVKIVKLMTFGAFAEIISGVDGLIHISQIANHRIATPAEVLHEGDQVDVKITDIDYDKHKVSLSIRALLDPDMAPLPAEEPVDEEPEDEAPVEETPAQETAEAPVEEEAPATDAE